MKYASNFHLPVIIHPEDYNLAGKGQIHAGKVASQLGLSGIPALAEEIIIARDIMLAHSTKTRLHVAHISTARSIELVRLAKKEGLDISCEVTPHHLTMTEDACLTFDTSAKMKPPLRPEKDRHALVKALRDGHINCVATDHAPHADFEKEREFDHAPFGVIGFETAFPVLYDQLVQKSELTLERLVEVMSTAPAKLLNLPDNEIAKGNPADLVLVDLQAQSNFSAENIASKSKNSPWLGKTLRSRIVKTICGGRVTWEA